MRFRRLVVNAEVVPSRDESVRMVEVKARYRTNSVVAQKFFFIENIAEDPPEFLLVQNRKQMTPVDARFVRRSDVDGEMRVAFEKALNALDEFRKLGRRLAMQDCRCTQRQQTNH